MKTGSKQLFSLLIFIVQITTSFSATLSTNKSSLTTTTTDVTSTTQISTDTTASFDKPAEKPQNLQNGTEEVQSGTVPVLPKSRLQRAVHSIHLVWLNLDHVRYPLVFTLVVIFAALSKIGKIFCYIVTNNEMRPLL